MTTHSGTMHIMWLSTLIIHYFSLMTIFSAHKKVNGFKSGGFLPDIYQIWDEVIWLTPEKRCLLSNIPICWEQIKSSTEVSQQHNYNDWKQLVFLPQEICNAIIPVFSSPSSGPPFAWPGTDLDWIWVMLVCSKQDLLDMWLLPMGMTSPCWVRRCTRGLPFTQGFISSELPEKPVNLPHHKTH